MHEISGSYPSYTQRRRHASIAIHAMSDIRLSPEVSELFGVCFDEHHPSVLAGNEKERFASYCERASAQLSTASSSSQATDDWINAAEISVIVPEAPFPSQDAHCRNNSSLCRHPPPHFEEHTAALTVSSQDHHQQNIAAKEGRHTFKTHNHAPCSRDNDINETEPRRDLSSKNVVSERNRRKLLAQKLYSLRTLVPNISKMDRLSIVTDAIDYVKHLQRECDEVESDVELMGHMRMTMDESSIDRNIFTKRIALIDRDHNKIILQGHCMIQLKVTQVEKQAFHVGMLCNKTPGVLAHITRALESLELEVVNANYASISDHLVSVDVVMQVPEGGLGSCWCGSVEKMVVERMAEYGLCTKEETKLF